MASAFEQLREFIQKQMRMSHIYQPVMLKELLTRGGKASIREIATAFLVRDESQLEYYEQITKNMPGKVLSKHGIVERDGKSYRLTMAPSSLSQAERDQLVTLCDAAVGDYFKDAAQEYMTIVERRSAISQEAFATTYLSAPGFAANCAVFRQMKGPLKLITSSRGSTPVTTI